MAVNQQEEYHRQPTEKEAQDWLYGLSDLELGETLNNLGLRKNGSRLEIITRAYKWLQGNYTAADFESTNDHTTAEEARLYRESTRKSLIDELCFERSSTTIQDASYEKGMLHPLSIFQNSTIRCELPNEELEDQGSETSQPINSHNNKRSEEELCDEQAPQDRLAASAEITEVMRNINQLIRVTSDHNADISETQTRQGIAINSLQMQMQQVLQVLNREQPRMPMSSTRIDNRSNLDSAVRETHIPDHQQNPPLNGGRVNFRDTFTCFYPQNSSIREDIPTAANNILPSAPQQAWSGIYSGDGTRRNATHFSQNSRDHEDPSRIVTRWNLKFSALPGENVETFLRRFEEQARAAKFSEGDMLASLSCVFADIASMWYSNNCHKWSTWQEFCQAFLRRWSNIHDKQERLRDNIRHRYQQNGESSGYYTTCMESMLRELYPPLSQEEEVNKIYMNLLPPIKRVVPREKCTTIDDLVVECSRAEYMLEREEADRTPLSPTTAVVPEAFKIHQGKTPQKPAKVAAAALPPNQQSDNNVMPSKEIQDIAATLKKLEKMFLAQNEKSNSQKGYKGNPPKGQNDQQRAQQKGKNRNQGQRQNTNNGQTQTSATNQNKGHSNNNEQPVKCFGCGKEGVIKPSCPNCSQGNEQKGG